MTAAVERRDAARAEAAAFLGLFCVGLWVTSFGPALPFIADETGVGLGTAGLMLTALAGGSITLSAIVSWRLGRVDARLLTAIGLAIGAAGLALLAAVSSFPMAIGAAIVIGIGDGLVVASTHALVTITAEDVHRDVNRLNVFFAIGAIIGPLWTGATLALTHDLTLPYAGLAVFIAASAVFAWRTPRAGGAGEEHMSLRVHPAVVLMGLVLFLYVGGEFGLGAWVSSFTERAAETGVMAGALVTCGYWGALAIGRLAMGWLLERQTPVRLLGASIALAGLSGLALVAVGDVLVLAFAAAFVTGLAFGPIWPLALAIGAAKDTTTSTAAALVTAGNSGAVVFPAAQGALLAWAGPREGIAMTPFLCLAMMVVLVSYTRLPAQSKA